MNAKITIDDIKQVTEELSDWAKDYGQRHDLRPETTGSSVEGAAIADGIFAYQGVNSEGLDDLVQGMATNTIASMIARSLTRGPQGMTNYLVSELGSYWLAGLSVGIELGRKFPKP